MEQDGINKTSKTKIRKVGPYYLLKPIGKGASSIVFEGKIQGTNKIVAIKQISLSKVKSRDYERVQMQIKILSVIRHRNIIELIDFKKTARHLYLVFEHCQNTDLDAHITKYYNGVMPEDTVRKVFIQIKKAFEVLRLHKIVHRDLKMANILVAEDFTIKIADFGFAGLLQDNMLFKSCLGTPLTMAPQVLYGQVYDEKCDIWSLGIILYQMLHGTSPFVTPQNMTLQALKQGILSKKLVFNPNIPLTNEVISLMNRMIVNDPKTRMTFEQFFAHPWLREDIECPSVGLRLAVLQKQLQKYVKDTSSNQANSLQLAKHSSNLLAFKIFSYYKNMVENKLFNNVANGKKLIGFLEQERSKQAVNLIFVGLSLVCSNLNKLQHNSGTLVVNDFRTQMNSYEVLKQLEHPLQNQFSKSLPAIVKKSNSVLQQKLKTQSIQTLNGQLQHSQKSILEEFFVALTCYLEQNGFKSDLVHTILKIKPHNPDVRINLTSDYLSKQILDLIASPETLDLVRDPRSLITNEQMLKIYKLRHSLFKLQTKPNTMERQALDKLYESFKQLL